MSTIKKISSKKIIEISLFPSFILCRLTHFTLQTEAASNMASKLSIAYFLNSGVMVFIIDVIVTYLSNEKGPAMARSAIYSTGLLLLINIISLIIINENQ